MGPRQRLGAISVPICCLAGVRGSRTHLPRSSRGITDLKSVPSDGFGYNLLTDFLNVKQEGVIGADLSDAYLHDVDLSDDYAIDAEEVETRPKPSDNHYY